MPAVNPALLIGPVGLIVGGVLGWVGNWLQGKIQTARAREDWVRDRRVEAYQEVLSARNQFVLIMRNLPRLLQQDDETTLQRAHAALERFYSAQAMVEMFGSPGAVKATVAWGGSP